MTTWKNIGRDDLAKVSDGDTLEWCDLSQAEPHTPILVGVKGLTFIKCNLVRTAIPEDAKAVDCNQKQPPLEPYSEPPELVTVRVDQLLALLDAVDASKVDVEAFVKRYHLSAGVDYGR